MNLPAGSRSPRPTNAWYNKVSEASQAYHRNKQRLGTGGMQEGRLNESALPVRIKNEHATAIPTYGMTRWGGGPIKDASLTDGIPDLILRTKASTSTTDAIGVAVDYIKNGNFGAIQTLGMAWARCVGPIAIGDSLKPNSSHKGVKDTASTPVIAKGALSSGVEGLIPVFIGAGGAGCVKKYQLFYLGTVTSGSFVLPVASQTKTSGVRSGAYTTENVTIAYNASVTDVKNAIEGHSLIDAGEVTVTGSLSLSSANHTIVMPEGTYLGTGGTGEITGTSLVGAGSHVPKVYLWECCS